MGTNFYLRSKQPRVVEVYDEMHVAKTSWGWRPLFDASASGCWAVAELKERYESGEWDIVDEYGDGYTWEEFERRVLGHCPDGKAHGSPNLLTRRDPDGYEFSATEFC